jgi:peptidoglycan/LPS O-acetylase OafA/YrhL
LFLLIGIALAFFHFGETIFHLLISIWFALLILVFIRWSVHLKRFRFFRTTESLGKYSYGLYVYSGFVMTFFTLFLPINNKVLLVSIELILIILISFVSYHLFEKKFLRLKKYFR